MVKCPICGESVKELIQNCELKCEKEKTVIIEYSHVIYCQEHGRFTQIGCRKEVEIL